MGKRWVSKVRYCCECGHPRELWGMDDIVLCNETSQDFRCRTSPTKSIMPCLKRVLVHDLQHTRRSSSCDNRALLPTTKEHGTNHMTPSMTPTPNNTPVRFPLLTLGRLPECSPMHESNTRKTPTHVAPPLLKTQKARTRAPHREGVPEAVPYEP